MKLAGVPNNKPVLTSSEWGWPQDEDHWKRVIQVVVEFIKTVCHYNWKIRNVIESNVLPEHHGIGDRYEDLIVCPTHVGILTKECALLLKCPNSSAMILLPRRETRTSCNK